LTPIFVELILVLIVILAIYPVAFFFICTGSVIIYIAATGAMTEWRAKYFKSAAVKDTEYN
jgi:ABC-type transport system involved in Fe-S cluster assembly fused permease/ATPase subunit